MLSSRDFPASDGIVFPKSPPRGSSIGNDGSTSPPGLIFSWARLRADEPEDEHGLDMASPRLWRPGSSARPAISSYPVSGRAQEIAKGRQELMSMYEGMPESAYELSLKDLVEQKEAIENPVQPRANRTHEKGSGKRTAHRRNNKKRNDVKGFLLNIFLPGNLTIGPTAGLRSYSPNSPRGSRRNGDQSSKVSSQESGRISPRPSHQSPAVSSSNVNSRISPKPCSPMPDSGKFDQRDQPSNCHSSEPKSKSPKRCSMCSEHAAFCKTNWQMHIQGQFFPTPPEDIPIWRTGPLIIQTNTVMSSKSNPLLVEDQYVYIQSFPFNELQSTTQVLIHDHASDPLLEVGLCICPSIKEEEKEKEP